MVGMVLLLANSVAQANLMGYTANGRNIYLTNFEMGSHSLLELNGLSSQVSYFEALEYSLLDGYLYAIGHWSSPLSFGSYNLWCQG